MENDFDILWCLVRAKIMVNENHFRFDRKTFFNFWKTIYGFKNRKSFSKIKLFALARMFDIRLPESGNSRSSESKRHRNLATSGHKNIVDTGIRQHPATVAGCWRTRFRPWSEAGRNLISLLIRPDFAKMAGSDRIRRSPARIRQRRPDVAGFRR
jgi:hypothetical protein